MVFFLEFFFCLIYCELNSFDNLSRKDNCYQRISAMKSSTTEVINQQNIRGFNSIGYQNICCYIM